MSKQDEIISYIVERIHNNPSNPISGNTLQDVLTYITNNTFSYINEVVAYNINSSF